MATVYLARDERHDRRVAVKVLRPELSVELGSDRFVREIHLAARLNHPHIMPLFDSGEAGGFLYYVMPVVEGESLRERLQHAKQLRSEERRVGKGGRSGGAACTGRTCSRRISRSS